MGRWSRATLIPNEPLRTAYLAYHERTGVTAVDVCIRLGWDTKDTSRLKRRLGLMSQQYSRSRRHAVQDVVDKSTAVAVCAAIGVDFDELYADLLPEEEPAGLCRYCSWELLEPDEEDTCGFCKWELEQFGRVDFKVAA